MRGALANGSGAEAFSDAAIALTMNAACISTFIGYSMRRW